MSYESPVTDPRLHDMIGVPIELKAPLKLYSAVHRFELGHAVAEKLGFPTRGLKDASYRMFVDLSGGLAKAIQDGPMFFETRAPEIAAAAVGAVPDGDLMLALDEIGRGKSMIDRGPVYKLPEQLRVLLRREIAEAVHTLLRRWDDTGLLAAHYTRAT